MFAFSKQFFALIFSHQRNLYWLKELIHLIFLKKFAKYFLLVNYCCILHLEKGKVAWRNKIFFFLKILKAGNQVLKYADARKKMQKLSKYIEVFLKLRPSFRKKLGHHRECYKKFTSFRVPTITSTEDETKKLARSYLPVLLNFYSKTISTNKKAGKISKKKII